MVEIIVNKDEEKVHNALLSFIRLKYKRVIFRTDGAGVFMPKRTAINFSKQQSGSGYPDLFLAHPVGGYAGLMIEIKKDDKQVLLKNLQIRSSKHIKQQHAVLAQLNRRGYYAVFGGGIDDCMAIVDAYMQGKNRALMRCISKYHLGGEK